MARSDHCIMKFAESTQAKRWLFTSEKLVSGLHLEQLCMCLARGQGATVRLAGSLQEQTRQHNLKTSAEAAHKVRLSGCASLPPPACAGPPADYCQPSVQARAGSKQQQADAEVDAPGAGLLLLQCITSPPLGHPAAQTRAPATRCSRFACWAVHCRACTPTTPHFFGGRATAAQVLPEQAAAHVSRAAPATQGARRASARSCPRAQQLFSQTNRDVQQEA